MEEKVEMLKYELDYRRTKQWNEFSWCSAILVAIIAGTVILNKDPCNQQQTMWIVITSFATIGLTTFSCLWLTYSENCAYETAKELERLTGCPFMHRDTGEKSQNGKKKRHINAAFNINGYKLALVVLAIAALVASWWPVYKGHMP